MLTVDAVSMQRAPEHRMQPCPTMIVPYENVMTPMMVVAMILRTALMNISFVNGRSIRRFVRTRTHDVTQCSSYGCDVRVFWNVYIWFFISMTATRTYVHRWIHCISYHFNTRAHGLFFLSFFFCCWFFHFQLPSFRAQSKIVCETNIVILVNTICETAFALPYIFIHVLWTRLHTTAVVPLDTHCAIYILHSGARNTRNAFTSSCCSLFSVTQNGK